MTVRVGPAGADGIGYPAALEKVRAFGLDCLEVTFTYGIRMREADAERIGEVAGRSRIALSVHAPYYINLASEEPEKAEASRRRVLDSCRLAHRMGAGCVVFHAGFYQKRSAKQTFERIREAVEDLHRVVDRKGWRVRLCPEITGKRSQFGSAEELLALMDATGCGITVDFSHWFARHGGCDDYPALLCRLPRRFHAHFSGIEYGEKGERRHVRTTETFFRPLAEALIARRAEVTLVSESPEPYADAAMMRRVLARVEKKVRSGRRRPGEAPPRLVSGKR
ncbi:MAG: TIM barrel protein [Desulfobacteraceae bacterium]|jgi:deoxyribonuclease-4|nr:TIM barrel protein [Desulfobacteraceae bacterium]